MIETLHPDEALVTHTKEKMKKKTIVKHTPKLAYVCALLTLFIPLSLIYITQREAMIPKPSVESPTMNDDGVVRNHPMIAYDQEEFIPTYSKKLVSASQSDYKSTASPTASLANFYISSSIDFLKEEKNSIYSPLSTTYALAMLTSGVSGTSKDQLEEYFGYDQLELEMILQHTYATNQISGLTIDNSIWFDQSHTLNINTLQAIADLYHATSYETKLSDQNAVDEISEYVTIQSKGLLEPNYIAHPDQAMKLLNIITLDASWSSYFSTLDQNHPNRFTLLDGTKADIITLQAIIHDASYKKTAQYELADVYLDNGCYMRVVLPNASQSLTDLTNNQEVLQEIANTKLSETGVPALTLELPEFTISNEWNLNTYLKQHGIKNIFQPSHDFDFMGKDLFVDEIKQLAAIEVNKYGLHSSTTTSVEMKSGGMADNTNMITMEVNRPFLYMIFSYNHEAIFIGTVYDPSHS